MSNTDLIDFDVTPKKSSKLTNIIIEKLRTWRDENVRNSKEALKLYRHLSYCGDVGQKNNLILYEQGFQAALDCHNLGEACLCFNVLKNMFPGSLRVMRHGATYLEAEENYEEAMKVLDSLLEKDPTDAASRKRRVALLKAQGLVSEAVKELVDYLKKFMSDMEAWQELCALYQQLGEYGRAAFCAEELLLHQPHNHRLHQRVADIRYTMGGVENLELARAYYSHALTLNPDNLRALLGLGLTAGALLSQCKAPAARREAAALARLAAAGAARLQDPAAPLTAALKALAL